MLRRALVDWGWLDREPDGSAYWLRNERPPVSDRGPE
jgi:hypothetical protein